MSRHIGYALLILDAIVAIGLWVWVGIYLWTDVRETGGYILWSFFSIGGVAYLGLMLAGSDRDD